MDISPSRADGSSTPTRSSFAPPATATPSPTRLEAPNMAPFEPVSSERMNAQLAQPSPSGRDSNVSIRSLMSPVRGHSRDGSIHDKISQFNTLAATQGPQKNDAAALKRAVLGREEAEADLRRYREEVRGLKKQIEEGKDRERKVGERLETVMESYGRAKETHAHTQALWEKEIRRTRKETFKSQSVIVKLQEELKSARTALKSAQDTLLREKERSLNREQEAFQARYNLVGLQEQLDKNRSELEQALDRIKVAEQERDAFKTLAKTEEVARIAAEGMLPLPTSDSQDDDDEFASPRKAAASRQTSLSLLDIKSSAASEAEIDELTRLWQWEKQRADRAADQVEYLEAECQLRACSCMRKRPCSSMSLLSPKRQKRGEPSPLADPSDRMILSEKATIPPPHATSAHSVPQPAKSKKMEHKAGRRETIFLPDLGTFQTVSAEEAEARNVVKVQEEMKENHMSTQARVEYVDRPMEDAPPHAQHQEEVERYVRTPSVEPPSYAVLGPDRQSLISLLDAPHRQGEPMIISRSVTPITPGLATDTTKVNVSKTRTDSFAQPQTRAPLRAQDPNVEMPEPAAAFKTSYDSRPHTTTSFYRTATQTSTVPLREENSDPSMAKKLMALQRTPSRGRVASDDGGPTWDVNNPALTPTMTREQALAKIRERRGRAKSGAVATPRKGMMKGVERRDLSAPAGRKGRIGS